MKFFKIIAVLMAVAALTSCSSARFVSAEEELNEQWVGASHHDIVREFGAPDRETTDGDGGVILIYEEISRSYDTDEDTHFGLFDTDYTTTVRENKHFMHFFIGRDGVCYLVKSNYVKADGRVFNVVNTVFAAGVLLPLVGGVLMLTSH